MVARPEGSRAHSKAVTYDIVNMRHRFTYHVSLYTKDTLLNDIRTYTIEE